MKLLTLSSLFAAIVLLLGCSILSPQKGVIGRSLNLVDAPAANSKDVDVQSLLSAILQIESKIDTEIVGVQINQALPWSIIGFLLIVMLMLKFAFSDAMKSQEKLLENERERSHERELIRLGVKETDDD